LLRAELDRQAATVNLDVRVRALILRCCADRT
jgi:hypothetical protein